MKVLLIVPHGHKNNKIYFPITDFKFFIIPRLYKFLFFFFLYLFLEEIYYIVVLFMQIELFIILCVKI